MTEKKKESAGRERLNWLDNLRTFMIFLVVVLHVGLVYESSGVGAFFWIVDDPATNDLSGLLNLVIDIFVMSALFFIAGFFVPRSLEKRTRAAFLRAKVRRLLLPWAVAVLTLIPLYKVIFLSSRNLPQQDWTTYFHWSNGIWGQNWLWFLPVLFLFNALYALLSRWNLDSFQISFKRAAVLVFGMGVLYSFVIGRLGWLGWTQTPLFDFQNERILSYFLIFLLGAHCYRSGILESDPKRNWTYGVVSGLVWIPLVLYVGLIVRLLTQPGSMLISETFDALMIHFTLYLSLFSMLYLMVETFRRYVDFSGPVARELSRNSYGVYIVHTVILGGIALLLLDTALPSLGKYLLVIVTTFFFSNVVISIFRRLKRLVPATRAGDLAAGRALTPENFSG